MQTNFILFLQEVYKMTKDQILDDLKFARDVAEQGRFAPLLGGRIGLMWGCLLVPTLTLHGAMTSRLLEVPINYVGFVWMSFGIIGGVLTGILSRSIVRKPGAQSFGNQVEQAVWTGATMVLFITAISVAYAVIARGQSYTLFDMIMALSFGTQAISYYVLAKISGEKTLYIPMLIALALVAIVVVMIGNPYAYFIAAVGVIFTVVIPALTHMKNEPKNVV